MMLNRWAMVHGRRGQPGYRLVCSLHWTRLGAASRAAAMEQAAHSAGFPYQTYWVERRRTGDSPGVWAMDDRTPTA